MEQGMSSSDAYGRGLALKRARVFEQAIDNFRQAARDPQYAGIAYAQIALCLKAIGRYDDAVMAFRQAAASPALASEVQLHIFYHVGRTLEHAGRYAESLEVYGWIRKENPKFGDVAHRIKHLCSQGRGPVPQARGSRQDWIGTVMAKGGALKSLMVILEQAGQWWGRKTQMREGAHAYQKGGSGRRNLATSRSCSGDAGREAPQLVPRKRTIEHRRCVRVPVQLHSYFLAKGRLIAGKGELRDLSPWGCRMTSAVAVSVGADLQCCIFPFNSSEACVIEGATVRWISPKEFGVAFTNVNPAVRKRIVQMCREAA